MFSKFYWLLPLVSALMWLATLLALLISWVVDGEPIYASMERTPKVQTIAYISDVGAQHLKPLFIAGAVIMSVCLDLGMLSERWLRHKGKLAPNIDTSEKIVDIVALLAAIAGAAGIILLSIFDTLRHPNLHDAFLILFIVGYVISAIFICAEYQRLGVKYRVHVVLRASFWIKLFFILVEIALAIPFGVLNTNGQHPNVAAILEWVIAFVFTFYVLSFCIDLFPAVRSRHHRSAETNAEWHNGRLEKVEQQLERVEQDHQGQQQHMLQQQQSGGGGYYGNGTTHMTNPAVVPASRNF